MWIADARISEILKLRRNFLQNYQRDGGITALFGSYGGRHALIRNEGVNRVSVFARGASVALTFIQDLFLSS